MTKQECAALLQRAINLLYAAYTWDDEASLIAQSLGLHGEKREERHMSRKFHMLVQHYRSVCLDLLDIKISPASATHDLSSFTTIKIYLEKYIEKTWATYTELQVIANELVKGCFKPLSCEMYKLADCLQDEIIRSKRLLKEYMLANEQYHHISRYEVSYDNVHDRLEKIEDKEGYID